MRRRPRQRPSASLLAALQLVLGLAAAADLVICREASGEIAVESTLAGDCCPDHGAVPQATLGEATERCRCVDTPLLASAVDVRPGRDPLAPPVLLPLLGSPPLAPVAQPCAAGSTDDRPRAGPSRVTLSTVVLLV